MNKVLLNVLGVSYSQTQTGAYALVLGEDNGARRLAIIIGGFEAQALAVQMSEQKPPRPLTHDLFYTFAMEYGIIVESVLIFKFEEGIFYSKLTCSNGGKKAEFDARTSDAIALALKFECPVYTTDDIMQRAGIAIVDEPKPKSGQQSFFREPAKKNAELKHMDISELEIMLNEAITKEEYERASKIRDEIKLRKRD